MQQGKSSIFIVGAPRSGTTLLTSFLVSHSGIISGPETQFFNKIGLGSKKLEQALNAEHWPQTAVNLMEERLTLSGQSVLSLYNKDREQVVNFLKSKSPSISAMLESIVSNDSVERGEERWLEKTPNHLKHIADIKAHFPVAKIILIHRDFRDSASSIPKLPWASVSIAENAALIHSWYSSAEKELSIDDVYVQSYEKLVMNPEGELRKLFAYIEEPFDNKILERKGAEAVTTENEPWKQDVYQKIDNQNLSKWKGKLQGDLLVQTEAILGNLLGKFGYEATTTKTFKPLRLKRLRKQKFEGLDSFASVLNNQGFKLSYVNDISDTLLFVENGLVFRAFLAAIKLKLTRNDPLYLLGKKNTFLSLLGRYLN